MSQRSAAPPDTLVRMSVPAQGDLRGLVPDAAAKVAELIGRRADAAALAGAIDAVAAHVAPDTHAGQEITFDFRQAGDDLLIEAHCDGRSSEVRCPLAA